ncbi:hypothetical protein BV898_09115 [Hypsibius exemplaris]|uniref:Guanylate cyclase domain-containing protein n=1 Tax=Hypsibius exemplaris TaxID=2072580 RepID=A0A1W0WNM1_HYPEX|nr:hypothetical protein BV898_09115 [Hypsibius exemplaris]
MMHSTEDGDEITVQEESDDRHHTAQTAMTLAFYNGATVSLQELPEPKQRATPDIVEEAASKGDVYSFGILLQQFFVRSLPYRTTTHKVQVGEKFKAMEIAIEVKNGAIPRSVLGGIGVALIRGEALIPEIYRGVTVQSSDISNFSVSTKDLSPTEIVNIITQIHATVDTILESSTEVICIESFLDDFLTVSGLPVPNGTRHAFELCLAALAFRKEIGRIVFGPANELRKLRLRSGIQQGREDRMAYWLVGSAI